MKKTAKATLESVAAELGLSPRTVSRALAPAAPVAPRTRARVLAALDRHGLAPAAPSAPVPVVLDIGDDLYMQSTAVRLQTRLMEAGCAVALANHRADRAGFFRAAAAAAAVVFCSFPEAAFVEEARAAAPRARLVNAFGGGAGADVAVDPDDAGGAARAARHLHALGHTRVLVATGRAQPNHCERAKAFMAEMRWLAPEAELTLADFSGGVCQAWEAYFRAAAAVSPERFPTAVFCTFGSIAAYLPVYAQKYRGLEIPRDLGVVSFDAVESVAPIDTLEFDADEVVGMVVRCVRGLGPGLPPLRVLVAPRFMARGGVLAAAAS